MKQASGSRSHGVPPHGVPSPGVPSQGARSHGPGGRTYVAADVEPLDVDGTRTIAVGSTLWLLAFVLLLPFEGLDDQVPWTCLAGFGLGMVGVDYCRRRTRRRRRHSEP